MLCGDVFSHAKRRRLPPSHKPKPIGREELVLIGSIKSTPPQWQGPPHVACGFGLWRISPLFHLALWRWAANEPLGSNHGSARYGLEKKLRFVVLFLVRILDGSKVSSFIPFC